MRRTHALLQLALAFSEDPLGPHWGYQLMKRAGIRSGVLYPLLQRMLTEGWIRDGWEDPAEIDAPRPARRYYELTEKGRRELATVIAEARTDPRFIPLLAWAGGAGR